MDTKTAKKQSEIPGNILLYYKWLPISLVAAALGFIIFWLYFLISGHSDPRNTEIHLAFEMSFFLPDIFWITPLLLLSAFWLKKGNEKGPAASTAAGGAMVFLGLVDISFNLQQGIYARSLSDAMFNGLVNLFTIGFGLVFLIAGGKLAVSHIHKKTLTSS